MNGNFLPSCRGFRDVMRIISKRYFVFPIPQYVKEDDIEEYIVKETTLTIWLKNGKILKINGYKEFSDDECFFEEDEDDEE